MNYFKLLLLSCVLTFTLCTSLYSYAAKPSMTVTNNQIVSYSQIPVSLSDYKANRTRFTLTMPIMVNSISRHNTLNSEHIGAIESVKNQNTFFDGAVKFNEKLQQVIAFFQRPNEKNLPTTNINMDEKAISKEKCKAS